MPKYKLTIAYIGTDFCGWQRQYTGEDAIAETTAPVLSLGEKIDECETDDHPVFLEPARPELRTVQAVVERAVRQVVREPVVIQGSSRTDAGVHAKGQVVCFVCSDQGGRTGGWPVSRGTESLVRAINSRLPPDVLVKHAEVVPEDFNPVRGCTSKAYTYTLIAGLDRPLWDRQYVMHIWQRLDVAAMSDAAACLVGEHDFAAFAAAGHGRKSTVRTIFRCEVVDATTPGDRDQQAQRVVITVEGSGFLWNMVRIIAGTLVEVGKGRMTAENIRQALNAGKRELAGPTLPPTGLCLEWIKYG